MRVVWIVSQCWESEGCAIVGVFDTKEKAEEFEKTFRRGLCYGPETEVWKVK